MNPNQNPDVSSLSFRVSFFWNKYKKQMTKKGPFFIALDILTGLGFFYGLHRFFFGLWPSIEAFCVTKYHKLIVLNALLVTWFSFVNGSFLLLHLWQPKFLDKYRVGKLPWRWNTMTKEEKRNDCVKTCLLTFFNINIVGPLYISLNYMLIPEEYWFKVDVESFPSVSESVFFFIVQFLVFDVAFYFCHRFLHLQFIYKYFHKVTPGTLMASK